MKTILRDRFHSPGSYKHDPDPLIRLGALYRLRHQAENAETKGELLGLLDKAINKDLVFGDSDRFLFLLHTAVLLSQNNSFEGVQWILHQIVTAPTQELRSIAVTALRNCTQFPFAVLLAQSIELSESNIFQKGTLSLMQTSEDDLYAISQKSSEEQKHHLLDFTAQIEAIRQSHCNSNRAIVLGTIVSRPVQKDFGYRYTGFVSLDDMAGSSLVVPYDMADVLNRDDRHARQSVWRLLGQQGHRAIFVFNTEGDQEVQVMYVLPFAVLSRDEMQQLIARLVNEARGLDIGVVVARWSEHNKTRYRLLTKSGGNMVQSYRADEQRIGNCFLVHSLNSKPLSTRYQIQAPFVAGCGHCFGTTYRVCEKCDGKGKVICPACEGSRLVECPDCDGSGRDNCGHCDGNGQVVITCHNCNGSGEWQGDCRNCEGTGTYTGTCKICGGSGQYADTGRTCKKCSGEGNFTVACRRCSGTGVVSGTCKRCGGQGEWTEQCKTCKGSGRWDCGTCHGKGKVLCGCEYGKVVCGNCNGREIVLCNCQSGMQGTIVPV
jgi:hypothetical protein